MKTVWLGTDERGEIQWHPQFRDFARNWGFTPQRPYRAQTKGKIESGVKYVRRNFPVRTTGHEPAGSEPTDCGPGCGRWPTGVFTGPRTRSCGRVGQPRRDTFSR
jgi:hypothetical protein